MRTIVVGIDGSPPSLAALRFAGELGADLREAELVVVFVRHIYLLEPPHVAEDLLDEVLDHAQSAAEKEAARILGPRGVPWSYLVREGEPSHVLREVAEDVDASFIVVGRQGWSAAHEMLVGTVSNRLVHRSDRPVLLVTG
jgi:nucleotide-binding universal stress UspA family protein